MEAGTEQVVPSTSGDRDLLEAITSDIDGVLVDVRGLQVKLGSTNALERQLLTLLERIRNGGEGGRRIAVIGYQSNFLPSLEASIAAMFDRLTTFPKVDIDRGLLLCVEDEPTLAVLARRSPVGRHRVVLLADTRPRLLPPVAARSQVPADLILAFGEPRDGAAEASPAFGDAPVVRLPWMHTARLSVEQALSKAEALVVRSLCDPARPYIVVSPELSQHDAAGTAVAISIANRDRRTPFRVVHLSKPEDPSSSPLLLTDPVRSFNRFGDALELPPISDRLASHVLGGAAAVLLLADAPNPQFEAVEVRGCGGTPVVVTADGRPVEGSSTLQASAPERMAEALARLDGTGARPALEPPTPLVKSLPRGYLSGSSGSPAASDRPRIGFMAAYPDRGFYGVPIYSRDTVNALAEVADVDLFTDQPVIDYPNAGVRNIYRTSQLSDILRYDDVLHVVNNHVLAQPAYESLLSKGGAAILHDAQILDLMASSMGHFGLQAYCELVLGRAVSYKEYSRWLQTKQALPDHFLGSLIERATALIVHSPVSSDLLKGTGAHAIYLPVAIQHPFRPEQFNDDYRSACRVAFDIPQDKLIIGTFGAVIPIKKDKEMLFALRDLRDWGYDVEFHIVGSCSDERHLTLRQVVHELQLEDFVRFASDISEVDYQRYLLAVDIGVQLRSIGYGQVSGALLDCISASLPTLASAGIAAAIEAPSYVKRIQDVTSPLMVAESLAGMIDGQKAKPRPRCDPEWSPYVEKHSFENYATGIRRALGL